jgi:hypothetical protein
MAKLTDLLLSENTERQIVRVLVKDTLELVWKKTGFNKSELQLLHLRGGTEESTGGGS